jgi:GntR family transcriptional regulator
VLRAIRLLRDEGILQAGRGQATTVTGTPELSALVDRVNDLVSLAASRGYARDELIELIRHLPA